tara:strand:+ start:217 stop:1314 length:1098 start_codon:yes stop_codon:yes gene_type:complete
LKEFTTSKGRIFGLDIIRAAAILIVVLVHGSFFLKDSFLEEFPYFPMLDGVELFFVLSGFLIGGILLREINSTDDFKITQLFHFWKRRWFRTLPTYYLILLANYFFVKYEIVNENINEFNYSFLVFTHNFLTPFYGFFWESWSLSIEEWFYIITPIFLSLFLRVFPPKLTFFITALIMILLPCVYRFYNYDDSIDFFWWDVAFRKTVVCRLDSIGYGLFAAWVFYYYRNLWSNNWAPCFILGSMLIIFVINLEMDPDTIYKQVLYFSLVSFSIMLILPAATRFRSAKGILPYIIEHISKISYSMYLINLGLVSSVIRDNFAPSNDIDALLVYFIYWIIVICASTLLYKYFEKPVMDLRDKKIKLF